MEDNYNQFDQKFRKALEKAPAFEPDERALADMARRLDEEARPRRRPGIAWWWVLLLPFLVLPFLFGTVYFYNKYENAQQKVQELSQRLIDQPKPVDTSSHHFVTYHYDTIYRTVETLRYVERSVEVPGPTTNTTPYTSNQWSRVSAFNRTIFAAAPTAAEVSSPNSFSSFINSVQYPWPGSPLSLENQAFAPQINRSKARPVLSLFDPLSQLPLPEAVHRQTVEGLDLDNLVDASSLLESKNRINPLWYFVPTGFHTSLSVNPALSLGISGNNSFGFNYGWHGELAFRKNLRLGLGVNKLDFNYELKSNFEGYPVADPENPSDQIKELYIFLSHLEVPVYFKYLFSQPDKKLRPFVNLGMIARMPLSQEFRYEYIPGAGGEYKRSATFSSGSFSIPGAQAGVGAIYAFNQKMSLSTQLLYKHDFQIPSMEYVKLNYLSLDLGLQFGF